MAPKAEKKKNWVIHVNEQILNQQIGKMAISKLF